MDFVFADIIASGRVIEMKRRLLSLGIALCLFVLLFSAIPVPVRAYTESDWVLASSAPADAQITDHKWTYKKTSYYDSRNSSESGYTLVSSEWVQSGSGSANYASFPSGFDTSHSIYKDFSHSNPYSDSETTTSKRSVSTTRSGYVYWHWAYNAAYANRTDRWISDRNQTAGSSRNLPNYVYCYFYAFTSSTNAPRLTDFTYTWTANGKYDSSAITYNCGNCLPSGADKSSKSGLNNSRFLRFDYYTATYTDYYKLFHYQKTENLESATEISASSSSGTVISDIKEYVKYKNSFTISYNANGGTNAPSAQTKMFGTPLTITSSVPQREGYDFLGWSISPDALSASYNPGSSFTSDTSDYTLFAVWQEKPKYVVTYDYKTNGGTSSSAENTSVYRDDVVNLAVSASKENWDFIGWNTDRNAETGLSSFSVSGNTTLFAIFSKTAKSNLYTERNELYSVVPKTFFNQAEGSTITLPPIPTYEGWTPVSWIRSHDGSEFAVGSEVLVPEDTSFYAKYVKSLTLAYDANGGESSPPSQSVALYYLADGSYEQEQPILSGGVEREGYSFDKWAYGSVDGTTYSAGDSLFLQEDAVMYATWTELPALTPPAISVESVIGGKVATIQVPEEDAIIYFTLDGNSPTASSSRYSGPINIRDEGQYTLKAIAAKQGYNDSPVAIESISLERTATPVSSVSSGFVRENTGIELSTGTDSGIIYYTTDGSIPTTSSMVYSSPINVSRDMTLKAVTVASGYATSEYATFDYQYAPLYSVSTYGYSFVNAASSFGYTNTLPSFLNYCIPYSSVKVIFGDSVKGKSAYTSMAKYPWGGNCCGLASTSALFYSLDAAVTPNDFGQSTVNRLRVTDRSSRLEDMLIRTFIEAMQISQYTVQFDRDYAGNKVSNAQLRSGKDLNKLYFNVNSDLAQSKTDIIAVGQSGVGAHALLAYDMSEVSDTEIRLSVYDCNHPNDGGRYVTLMKNASGDIVGWEYDMGGYGVWGSTSNGNSYISYIPFDTIYYIWENRGRLFDNYLTLTVDSENVAIYNLDGELVGEFRDGEFNSLSDDVFAIPNLCLTSESDLSVYLPEDFYVVTNLGGGEFEASMVGESLGATITTDAETVCFELNEALQLNSISVENAGSDNSYTISLDSSYINTDNTAIFRNVTISGTGVGDTMRLSNSALGTPIIENSSINSYKINGVEQISYLITSLAGTGGTISPKGDSSVPAGSSKTYTITPSVGYRIKDVIVDGFSIGAENEFTFEKISRDHFIRASFEPAFSLEAVQLNAQSLSVSVKNESSALLCAAVYSLDGKMILIKEKEIEQNASVVQIPLGITLPERSRITVFLLSKNSSQPLCESKSIVP